MTQSATFRSSLLSLLVASVVAFETATAMAEADPASMREEYVKALDLYGAKKLDESKKILLEIWPKSKTHDVATLLGQIEMKKSNYADAARYFAFAVSRLPPTEDVKKVEILKKWLASMKQHVASYELRTNVAGAAVSVDGVDYGVTPLDTPIFVTSGKHIVMLTLSGYKSADAIINGVDGTTEKLEITLQPEEKAPIIVNAPSASAVAAPKESAAVPAPQPFQETPREPAKANPLVLVGGGVIAVGGLVTGLVFNAKANSHYDEADKLKAIVGRDGCAGANAATADCSSLAKESDDGDRNRTIALAGFGIGGVALVATAAYWLWPRSQSAPSASNSPGFVTAIGKDSAWVGFHTRY